MEMPAESLYQVVIGVVIPLVVSSMKRVSWPAHYKFGLVLLLSLVAAAIVPVAQMSADTAFDVNKFVTMLGVIFTTTQLVYQGAIKYMDFETELNPRAAILSQVKELVGEYIDSLSAEDVKALNDPESSSALSVEINHSKD